MGVIKLEKNSLSSRAIPYIAYFNICVLWGTSNVVAKIGLCSLNVSVLAFIRYLIAGSILLAISLFFKLEFPKEPGEWKILAIISVLMIFFTIGFIALGNKYTDSGLVTIIQASVPIFTTIIECFFLKTYDISLKGTIGLISGFIGIGIIVFNFDSLKLDFKGIIFALMGTIAFSIGSIYSKNKVVQGSAIAQTTIETLLGTAMFFVAGKISGDFVLSNITFHSLLPVFYLAIADSLIGFISYIYLLKVWKSSKVTTYAYINPVVALILGSLLLNEVITLRKVLGMIIIVTSVVLIQSEKPKEPDNI